MPNPDFKKGYERYQATDEQKKAEEERRKEIEAELADTYEVSMKRAAEEAKKAPKSRYVDPKTSEQSPMQTAADSIRQSLGLDSDAELTEDQKLKVAQEANRLKRQERLKNMRKQGAPKKSEEDLW
jgi:predicted RNA-binding protein with PUA-like domain